MTIGLGSLDGAMRGGDVDRAQDFEAFVAAHRDRAVGLAWRLLGGDAAAAEDVAQEAFLRAYRGLDQFREMLADLDPEFRVAGVVERRAS